MTLLTLSGHAGAMLQAKQLGNYLVVGVHSDQEILDNKGPTVMNLRERMAAVAACKWADLPVPGAPYVTDPVWMDQYGCTFVVHGDDVTTDATGEDCYRVVKAASRFQIVKRTPGISTTDLVGRMLLCTKTHHLRNLGGVLLAAIDPDPEKSAEREHREAAELLERIEAYASDAFGVVGRGSTVFVYTPRTKACNPLVTGMAPKPGQRVVYVDGGFDLFSSGHIEFLRRVVEKEHAEGNTDVYVVAGVHDDKTINYWKGLNYPIMNMFERGLCVLQCRVRFKVPFFYLFFNVCDSISTRSSSRPRSRLHAHSCLLSRPASPTLSTTGQRSSCPAKKTRIYLPHLACISLLPHADNPQVRGSKGARHIPGGWRARVCGCQRGRNHGADPETAGTV